MSNQKHKTRLLAIGNIVKTFHYEHFASNWWAFIKKKNIWIPWRVNCCVCVDINEKQFVLRVIVQDNNSIEPGFISEIEPNPQIHSNISAAINITYKKLFKTETRYSGLNIFDSEDNEIIKQLLSEVLFQPFQIKQDNITIFIAHIGVSDNETLYFAGSEYISSFNHKVCGDQCLVVQTINEHNVSIHVYRHGIQREEHFGMSPKEVWKKMTICQEKNPMVLFGLTNLTIQNAIKQQIETPLCNFKQWMDLDIMTSIFQKYLKRRIGISDLPWHNFFKWLNQKNSIIELTTTLAHIYPANYKIGDREFRAWKQLEFWTCAIDYSVDKETISTLYQNNLLNITISSKICIVASNINVSICNNKDQKINNETKFWKSFSQSIKRNKQGLDGKQQILSIIAKEFGPTVLHEKLQVSNNLITAVKNFARINGPGCSPITKPIITCLRVSKIQDQQFEAFFFDKNNVSISSYIVDKKTSLPLLYLKDNKQTLWERFEAIYPDGIKRTSFMARLTGGRYVYKQDLGGLCNICNDYGYEVFDLLIELIETNIIQKEQKQTLIREIETLRLDGKQQILSIIAKEFGPTVLHEKLQVSNNLITAVKNFARINGPGCSPITKPIITCLRVSKIQDQQFEAFFFDKNNVSISSYIVDKKTSLPLLYLKDNKQTLWERFEAIYPDGIKRTSFMARLTGGRYVYKQDLGGLCNICNDYGYEVFDLLIELIETNIIQKEQKQTLIREIETLRYHMRREYEKELLINSDGTTDHVSCINHCLQYAFGKYILSHSKYCKKCNQLFDFFNTIKDILPSEHHTILEESKEKLVYFLAHQARKTYLNTQFKVQLLELDDESALILADYKMKILPKSACEKKEQFFGKRGWTLHTIIVFTKKNTIVEAQAFDHWSLDTRQDAWFTASSFDAVFETLEIKPRWIKIFSDNGGHYHCSEMMAIVRNWYQWYNIDVRGWYFFELGEVKSLVDSHHATISHAIKRYIRIRNTLDSGEKIQIALEGLQGTSIANIEPCRDHVAVKTINNVSNLFHWEWPIDGEYTGFIMSQSLPNIGDWECFSPSDITKLVEKPIHKPTPSVAPHTKFKQSWTIPLPQDQVDSRYNLQANDESEEEIIFNFPLPSGWALKSNQRLGKRGSGKRMTERVKSYLYAFFLAGEENKTERMSANEMVQELNELVKEGEIQTDDIPQVKTVENWISRTSATLRKQAAADQRQAENNNGEASQAGEHLGRKIGVKTNTKGIQEFGSKTSKKKF
ncbi:hypothetical protein Glove_203g37 [Diversispora epigaea]|uniref:Uncharacterized protein n=1 Tax=Diversispora epigaea TaxID=1348612 RepID=A0A397IMS6_9GLOM|nr:hypothetical protein Glove_203g37 [Diversispora epigaea]